MRGILHPGPAPAYTESRGSRLTHMASSPDPEELAALRREYGDSGLDHPDLAADPVAMLRRGMHDTVAAGLHDPNAMVGATISGEGRPSLRIVLVSAVGARGFV